MKEFGGMVVASMAFVFASQVAAGETVTPKGKTDRLIVLMESFDDLPLLVVAKPEVLPVSAPLLASTDLRIEPSSGEAGWESELRYNLQRTDVPWTTDYDMARFTDQISSIRWDVAGAFGMAAVIGFSNWGWGESGFRFADEGWFEKDTEYLGMDKLGHAYTGYVLADYFTQRIAHETRDPAGAALTGAVLGMGIQTYVEVLDGFSDNGFSWQDMAADGLGVGFAVLRNTVPGLADKVDFRMEYVPSGNDGGYRPYHDYTGQKYVLALKLGGFEALEDTPLRFMELQAGYFARGFTDKEKAMGQRLRREPYVAIGFNLQQLLDEGSAGQSMPGLVAKRLLEYNQLPYTYLASEQD